MPARRDVSGLVEADVLRGEKVEIIRPARGAVDHVAATFVYCGSHHKAIDVDDEGRAVASRTSMTGELLDAVARHTILRDAVAPLDAFDIDDAALRAGADACRRHGFGRAAFLIRVGRVLEVTDAAAATSFLFGGLAALDLPLLDRRVERVVLYGRGVFPEALALVMEGSTATDDLQVVNRASRIELP